jgi:UDP-N-acetylmuramate dehydrogenase
MNSAAFDLTPHLELLQAVFGSRLQENAPLARLTAARVGGPVDAMLTVNSAAELAEACLLLWRKKIPFYVLGGGSNVLVSDRGVHGVVVLNRAKVVKFYDLDGQSLVWAESGANLGMLARQAASKGLSGLEWAAGVPGTVGGAVVGNAGAHGGDMAGNLKLAEILHVNSVEQDSTSKDLVERWPVERLEYGYRTSLLKRQPGQAVVLAAELSLQKLPTENHTQIEERMEAFNEHRRKTQPPGASMGSMFKNPAGDYAGRLIEAAGLKGLCSGKAQISPLHANFFVNLGGASAADVRNLLDLAREKVKDQFGVQLELEIELLGEWDE